MCRKNPTCNIFVTGSCVKLLYYPRCLENKVVVLSKPRELVLLCRQAILLLVCFTTNLQHVFRFFLLLARLEYSLLASEENEEDREVSLLVLLSETCSESPHLSDPSAIFLHEPVTGQSPHDFGQREPIERDELHMFLKSASQARNPFVQQLTT